MVFSKLKFGVILLILFSCKHNDSSIESLDNKQAISEIRKVSIESNINSKYHLTEKELSELYEVGMISAEEYQELLNLI